MSELDLFTNGKIYTALSVYYNTESRSLRALDIDNRI